MPSALKKILLVDDEKEVLVYLGSILRRANYEAITTTKGRDAVDLAIKHKPDLVILDIVLPDLDGGDVASFFSKNPSIAHIPIVFLTGILRKEEEASVSKGGKHLMLAKPVTKEALLATIEKIIPR